MIQIIRKIQKFIQPFYSIIILIGICITFVFFNRNSKLPPDSAAETVSNVASTITSIV